MSILPSFMETAVAAQISTTTAIPVPKEYGIDFDTGQLTGKVVEGLEAIKVWIWCCMRTPRFRYPIYTWQYGTSFEDYIGTVLSNEYVESDCQAEITEALMVNPYITGIEDFSAVRDGAVLRVRFTVLTRLGEIEVSDYV